MLTNKKDSSGTPPTADDRKVKGKLNAVTDVVNIPTLGGKNKDNSIPTCTVHQPVVQDEADDRKVEGKVNAVALGEKNKNNSIPTSTVGKPAVQDVKPPSVDRIPTKPSPMVTNKPSNLYARSHIPPSRDFSSPKSVGSPSIGSVAAASYSNTFVRISFYLHRYCCVWCVSQSLYSPFVSIFQFIFNAETRPQVCR